MRLFVNLWHAPKLLGARVTRDSGPDLAVLLCTQKNVVVIGINAIAVLANLQTQCELCSDRCLSLGRIVTGTALELQLIIQLVQLL